jgi:pSer/pThr/pTyr-binding forkhead associated (FHA) protein
MQILIGRSEACDLVLNDPMISRRNTKIKRDWSGVTITDLNSKNGTFVNNEKISEKVLKDGDEFRIGESRGFFRNPKESFGREAEEESEPLAAAVPDQPVISRPEPYPTMAKTPPLPPAPAPARPYTPPPAFQPPPSAIEPSALGEREPEYDYEPAGFLKTMKPIDYVIIGVGIVIFIGCIVVLLKILF